MNDEIQRLKSAISELTLLNELALAASSSLESDRVLDIIVEKSIKAVKAEQGSIMLVTAEHDTPLQTLIRQADHSGALPGYKVGTHISGWVLKYRQPLIIENLATDDRFNVSADEAKLIRSVLCVPISFKGNLLGILIMTNKKSGDSFSTDDLRLLTIIAAQSGQLIRNAQLQADALEKNRLESELDLARNIQIKLLPEENPLIPGLDIASFFRPHKSVSGDYYDFFKLGKDKFGLMIADVSGHGPSAALVMTLIKGIVHSVITVDHSPATALERINTIASKIIPADMFVTMIYLIFDTENNKVSFSNAGHNPLLYFNLTEQNFQIEEASECPLNVMKDVQYKNHELNLSPGDLLLLYTDGLTESTNAKNEMFGINRLGIMLKDNYQEKVSDLIKNIKSELDHHLKDSEQSDDIVIIALRFKS